MHTGDTERAEFCRKLMEFVLSQNVFIFDTTVYRQRHGTAMGTKFAPPFANIYIADLEESYLQECLVQPSLWVRYIDDIIMKWDHSLFRLIAFMDNQNDFDPDINFTYDISLTECVYLDLVLTKGPRFKEHQILDTSIHIKKTNKFMYIPYQSSHPIGVKTLSMIKPHP